MEGCKAGMKADVYATPSTLRCWKPFESWQGLRTCRDKWQTLAYLNKVVH